MKMDPRSLDKLQGVHPDLAHVTKLAGEKCALGFRITEGLRDRERQKMLVRSGKSKTMNSRHLTGHAVDFVAIGDDGVATFDMPEMTVVATSFREAGKELGVPIEWGAAAKYGGDFKTFNDSPHIQLPWKSYPAVGVSTTTKVIEAAKKPAVAVPVAVTTTTAVVKTVPSIPLPLPPDISALTSWQAFGGSIGSLWSSASSQPLVLVACAGIAAFFYWLPQISRRFGWQQS